ncbi:MAG: isoprenyl transferase [Pseudomonadota bacterium]
MTALSLATNDPADRLHVAIIMDGNGRWAKQRGLPRTAGHRQGAEAVRRAVQAAVKLEIGTLTLFGFSAENWKRPLGEVTDLMGLLRFYLRSELEELHEQQVRLAVIGERDRLPDDVRRQIAEAEERTAGNSRLLMQVALSYGARQEMTRAARALAQAVAEGRLSVAEIDEQTFATQLFTASVPDPDIILRTSGEQRLSNFLLWQSAYSELIFIDKYWPDFGEADLAAAVAELQSRDRRFGALAKA